MLNDTRVLPARLHGINRRSGGEVEILLLRPYEDNCWEVLVKPGKRARKGAEIEFSPDLSCQVLGTTASGGRLVQFNSGEDFAAILYRVGETPPYLLIFMNRSLIRNAIKRCTPNIPVLRPPPLPRACTLPGQC